MKLYGMPECYSSGLLQEISCNIWRELVGGSIQVILNDFNTVKIGCYITF